MSREITAFGCEFCAMTSRRRSSVVRHERQFCRKNPERKRCGNCIHLSVEKDFVHEGTNSIAFYTETSFYCLALDIDLPDTGLNENNECSEHITVVDNIHEAPELAE